MSRRPVLCSVRLVLGVVLGVVLGLASAVALADAEPPCPFVGAAATDRGVALLCEDGWSHLVPDTLNTRGVAFAGDNETLYVAGEGSLRRVRFDGQVVRLLTDGWEMIDGPAVSPDGRSVAFSGYTGVAKWGVYELRGRNANPFRVATGLFPAWLPDSRTLVFENYTDESAQIYVHDPNTRSVERFIHHDGGRGRAVSISITPDGHLAAYSVEGAIWIRDRLSGTERQVTDGAHYDAQVELSADGSQVLFVRHRRDPKLGRIEPRAMLMILDAEQRSAVAATDERVRDDDGAIQLHAGPVTSVALPHGGEAIPLRIR